MMAEYLRSIIRRLFRRPASRLFSVRQALFLAAVASLPTWCVAQIIDVTGIDHVAVRVVNLQKSADWYQARFGFAKIREWKGVWMVGKGNVRLGLFLVPSPLQVDDPDGKRLVIDHLAFSVSADAFQAALDRLRADKVPFAPVEDTGIAYSVFLTDPDGHQVELTTYHTQGGTPPK